MLDPTDITIAATNRNLAAVASPTFQDNGGGGAIAAVNASALGTALTGNAIVNVQTSNAGNGAPGQITVNSAITATGAGTLNLIANGAITVNAAITRAASLTLNVGLYAGSTGTPATIATAGGQAGAITTAAGGTITTGGGTVTMVSGSGSAITLGGAITTNNGNVSLKSGGALTVNAGLNAGTGIVRIQATGAVTQSAAGSVASGTTGVRAASVDLTTSSGNRGNIAMNASTGVAKYLTQQSFNVSSVAAEGTFAETNGVTTNNQDITLVNNSGSNTNVNNVINAGTGTVRLGVGRGVGGNATGVITAGNLAVRAFTNNGDIIDLSQATHAVSGNLAVRRNGTGDFTFKNSLGFNVGSVSADSIAGLFNAAINGLQTDFNNVTLNAAGTIKQTTAITGINQLNVTTTAGNINLSNTSNNVGGTVNLSAAAGGVAFTNNNSNGIKVGDITAATSTNSTVATDIANFTASDAALTGVVLLLTTSSKALNIERVGATKIVADRTVLVAGGRIGGTLATDATLGIRVEGAAGASARQVFVSAGSNVGGGATASIFGPTTAVPQFYNGLVNGATALPSPTSTTYNGNAMTLSAASTATPVVAAAAAAVAATPATGSTTTNTGTDDATRRAQTIAQIQLPKSTPPEQSANGVTPPRVERANGRVSNDLQNAPKVEPITIPSCAPGAARQAAPGQCG